MADLFIFDKTYKVLGKALDISAKRNGLLTSNIANIDTVGYTPKDLDFKKTLQKELDKKTESLFHTHPEHFKHGSDVERYPIINEDNSGFDGLPQVNIDTEMTKLVENNINYRTSVEMLLRKMGMLKHAITEGGAVIPGIWS